MLQARTAAGTQACGAQGCRMPLAAHQPRSRTWLSGSGSRYSGQPMRSQSLWPSQQRHQQQQARLLTRSSAPDASSSPISTTPHSAVAASSSSSSGSIETQHDSPSPDLHASDVEDDLDLDDDDLDLDENIISLDDIDEDELDGAAFKAALLQAQQQYLGDLAEDADRRGNEEDFWSQDRERVYLVGVSYKNWSSPQEQAAAAAVARARAAGGAAAAAARRAQQFDVHSSLEELGRLADTAGLQVVGTTYQALESPNPASYIGSGKVAEVTAAVRAYGVETVIFDDELSPAQLRNLEKAFRGATADDEGVNVSVCDRTALILDIFSQRARTREGKLQVELAQVEYQLPRLTRMWSHLDRVGGGGQVKGTGEKQIEIDKRLLRDKAASLRRELDSVRMHRAAHRERRSAAPIPVVALVGYTNAGKSTLLNTLTAAGVLAEDKLFATLDPTTRKVRLPGNLEVLLSDTVGFIQKLPTQLVAAFRATLEEIREASLIVHVLDASADNAAAQCNAVLQVLDELGVKEVPVITAWNKADAVADPAALFQLAGRQANTVAISGASGTGLDTLLEAIAGRLQESMTDMELLLPYTAGDLLDDLHKTGRVHSSEYNETGTRVTASVPPQMVGVLQRYALQSNGRVAVQGTQSTKQAAAASSTSMVEADAASSSYATGDWEEQWDGDYDDSADMSYEDYTLAAEARAAVAAAAGVHTPGDSSEEQQQEGNGRRRRRGKGRKAAGGGSWLEQHQLPDEWGQVVQATAAAQPQAAVRQ